MVRWLLNTRCPITSIFNDFIRTKCFEFPISLRKLLFHFGFKNDSKRAGLWYVGSLGISTCNRSRPIGARLNKFGGAELRRCIFPKVFWAPSRSAAVAVLKLAPVEHVDGSRQDSRMGRFRSLFICGFNSYQKFDEQDTNTTTHMAYKCTHCGHKQKLKVRNWSWY